MESVSRAFAASLCGWMLLSCGSTAWGGDVLLIRRVRAGDLHAAASLIDSGADIDARDKGGWTALVHAADNGFEAIVVMLLEKGANPNLVGKAGEAPLHRAALAGHPAVVSALIAARARLEAVNSDGKTALHLAAQKGRVDIVRLLLDAGAQVNPLDKNRWTPLQDARLSASGLGLETYELLRSRGGKTGKRVRAEAIREQRLQGKLPVCHGLLGARWGMSRQEVIEQLPNVMPLKGSTDLVLEEFVDGRSAKVFFRFEADRLKSAVVLPEPRLDAAGTVADFHVMAEELKRRYGPAESQERAWRRTDTRKGIDEVLALQISALELQSIWETDWTRVVLTCQNQAGQVRITLAYQSVVRFVAKPQPDP
jgi:hypothetical protein